MFNHRLEVQRLHSRKCCADTQIELDSGGHCICLPIVESYRMLCGTDDVSSIDEYVGNLGLRFDGAIRSLDVAESCSLDFEATVRLYGNVSDLGADVLSFSVAVGPYKQSSRTSGLSLDVLSDDFLVLARC